jgi:oligo-1,6-glucosidase
MMTRELHMPGKAAFALIRRGARDHARTPMQWDSTVNAGFNKGAEPWQPMNRAYRDINVGKDLTSDKSIYRFYQKLIDIKKTDKTAIYGDTIEYDPDNRKIIMYSRSYQGRRLLIAGNFSGREAECIIPPDFALADLKIRLANYDDPQIGRVMKLRPYEAILFEEL